MNGGVPPEVRDRFRSALAGFLSKDGDLLGLNVNERSITHCLAEHLHEAFPDYNVDCEYNRQGNETKRLPVGPTDCRSDDLDAVTVYPDIIIHKRGVQDNNLLVIEVKKSNARNCSADNERDINKLQGFTDPRGEYRYKVGVFLILDVNNKGQGTVRWFIAGEPLGEPVGIADMLADLSAPVCPTGRPQSEAARQTGVTK